MPDLTDTSKPMQEWKTTTIMAWLMEHGTEDARTVRILWNFATEMHFAFLELLGMDVVDIERDSDYVLCNRFIEWAHAWLKSRNLLSK